MSVHHSSMKHISFCRQSSQVLSYHKRLITYFVIIQITRGNGRTVERNGCTTFKRCNVQQRSILSYKLLTYYLLIKNANFYKTRSALKCLHFYISLYVSIHFYTFLYIPIHLYIFLQISIWLGIFVLDSGTPSGKISNQSQERWLKLRKRVYLM